MREIIFKAVKIDGSRWVEGDLVHGLSGKIYISLLDNGFWTEVIPETVCQYTGLKDRHGKRVFDDDKFAPIDKDCVYHSIGYDDDKACCMIYSFSFVEGGIFSASIDDYCIECCGSDMATSFDFQKLKVTGNIHDHL